jgi:hypothetical protein
MFWILRNRCKVLLGNWTVLRFYYVNSLYFTETNTQLLYFRTVVEVLKWGLV